MTTELSLPSTLVRRNKLDISLGYCNEIFPGRLMSLGPAAELRLEGTAEIVDFLLQDAHDDHVHFVRHVCVKGKEWEYVCFARRGDWTIFCSIFSTALAYNPVFGDGKRRRLCSGGTRIINRKGLEEALHRPLQQMSDAVENALLMDLDLAEAMTGKNLSNGFNIGGCKTLVYIDPANSVLVPEHREREFAAFMARFHNSILQSLPIFIGTGSDLNFKGSRYYDLCSRISPSYVGSRLAARRWGRETAEGTALPTAQGVIASIDAVTRHLSIQECDQSILVKGVGGVGGLVARHYLREGWKVYATELEERIPKVREEFGSALELVPEEKWGNLPSASIFSPNASSGSLTADNLPVLEKLGVKAVVGGENNVRKKDLDPDRIYQTSGILTFADFLVNGGGAWIVGAEMLERPVDEVRDWFKDYQVPTVVKTIDLARDYKRSPEAIFLQFISEKVQGMLS